VARAFTRDLVNTVVEVSLPRHAGGVVLPLGGFERNSKAESTGKHIRGQPSAPIDRTRGKTVSKPLALEPLGLALSEKQIPQIIETIRSMQNQKKLWRPPECAQGRCATRLRYAPTVEASLILNHFPTDQPLRNSFSALKRIKTVSRTRSLHSLLYQNSSLRWPAD